MRGILVSDEEDAVWSKRAREVIASLRAEHEFLRSSEAPMLVAGEEITWWTHAGGRANLLLAKLTEAELGGTVTVRNESLTPRGEAGQSVARLQTRISKFEACLPAAIVDKLAAEMVVDGVGARAVVECGGM